MFKIKNLFKKPMSKKSDRKLIWSNIYSFLKPDEINQKEILRLLQNINTNSLNSSIIKIARNITLTHPLINGHFKALEGEILGDNGFILDMHTDNKELNRKIESDFWDFCNTSYKGFDFWDLESLILLNLERDGEAFVYVYEKDSFLGLSIIDPLNVDFDYTIETKGIYNGIEILNDEVKAYYIKDEEGKLKRVEAKNILHIFRKENTTQIRGLSKLVSVIESALNSSEFLKAELKRARLQSEITGFFTKPNDETKVSIDTGIEPLEEEKATEEVQEVQVGKMRFIDEDLKPTFIESHNDTNIAFFIQENNRNIAKGLGVSYATLTGDLSQVNYSSSRNGISEQRRYFKRLQNFLIRKFHNIIFEKWVLMQVKSNLISLKDYKNIIYSYTFKPQGWEFIDPQKEINANKIAIESGQKTITEVLREKGKEFDTHIEEMQKEQIIHEILAKTYNKSEYISQDEEKNKQGNNYE